MNSKIISLLIGVGALIGLTAGWFLWGPKKAKILVPQPAIHQSDGSIILPTAPSYHPEPKQQIPHGATVEHVVSIDIKPNDPIPNAPTGTSSAIAPIAMPTVHLDLTLVKMGDGSQRVIASSPDGTIVNAIDIPSQPTREDIKPLKYALGISYASSRWGTTKSLVGERDWGWLRVAAHVGQTRLAFPGGATSSGPDVGVALLVRF